MNSYKMCAACGEVKIIENDFYRAGASYQKLCKPCHNKTRRLYKKSPKIYVPRPVGVNKLPTDIKNGIIYDIHIKINCRKISEKYGVCYSTLLLWKQHKQIPEYTEELFPKPEIDKNGVIYLKKEEVPVENSDNENE